MQFHQMKYWILFFGLFLCHSGLRAQETHFIYIQTENSKPFYIKFQGNVISSSAAGYVIIPRLVSGDYQINIGFPRNEYPEEEFHFSLSDEDMGFLLKNFREKGWSLFNLQSMELIAGVNAAPPPAPQQQTTNNAFTRLLAAVVQDSSLLIDNTPVTTAVAPEKKDTALKKDTTTEMDLVIRQGIPVWNDNPVPDPNKKEELKEHILPGDKQLQPENKNTGTMKSESVMKIMSMYDVDGMEFIYLDKALNDTIRIFLPAGSGIRPQKQDRIVYEPEQPKKEELKNPEPPAGEMGVEQVDNDNEKSVAPMEEKKAEPVPKIIFQQDKPVKEKLTITPTILTPEDLNKGKMNEEKAQKKEKNNMPVEKLKDEALSRIIYEPAPDVDSTEKKNERAENEEVDNEKKMTVEKIPMVLTSSDNKNCKNFATHHDFLELRKKMAAEMEMEAMLDVARENFRSKCYTTEQMKNLSYLFLKDEGKYRFYDMAYRHVSDQERFFLLEQQLKDEYYINRFKAMVSQ